MGAALRAKNGSGAEICGDGADDSYRVESRKASHIFDLTVTTKIVDTIVVHLLLGHRPKPQDSPLYQRRA